MSSRTVESDASNRPRIGILALQGDFAAHAEALGEAGAEAILVRKPEGLTGLAGRDTAGRDVQNILDGLILPGGESTTFLRFLERDGFWQALEHFVRTKPVFGTCAGCILLAKAITNPAQKSLGVLDVSMERNAYGRQIDSSILNSETKLAGGPLEMVYIRAPRITSVGPGVEVLAERDGFPVLVRQDRILASTFHPELSQDRRVHRLFVELVRASRPESLRSTGISH